MGRLCKNELANNEGQELEEECIEQRLKEDNC
jgi:hypothetical protein